MRMLRIGLMALAAAAFLLQAGASPADETSETTYSLGERTGYNSFYQVDESPGIEMGQKDMHEARESVSVRAGRPLRVAPVWYRREPTDRRIAMPEGIRWSLSSSDPAVLAQDAHDPLAWTARKPGLAWIYGVFWRPHTSGREVHELSWTVALRVEVR